MAGSYYIEYLTDQMESKVLDYLEKIEDIGGAVAAVEQGYMQREIHDKAYRYKKTSKRVK